jgi:hypothetical protein
MKTVFLLAILASFSSMAFAQDTGQSRPAKDIEPILANMPENSDRRCLGISLVAAALLKGEKLDGDDCDVPEDLAKRIYEAAFDKARVRFQATLCLDTQRVPITSREGLNALATAVADRYKQRYFELIATEEGKNKLWDAERNFVKSRRALAELLEAEAGHIACFAVVGERTFPDGVMKDTNHVILIAKHADGEMVIYDPNDPGRPITCRFQPASDGILITWTCRYRDTGITTIQQYRIIEIDRYFREALAQR